MNDEAIKGRLRQAGVPKDVFSTTLVKSGFAEIRGAVMAIDKGDIEPVLFIHREGVAMQAYTYSSNLDLAFYLAAKELVLLGNNVFCCTLADIHTALFRDTEEAEELQTKIAGVSDGFIAIRGFQDVGGAAEQFMTPYESAYFSSWLIGRQQRDGGIILQGFNPLMNCGDWWPMSLLGYFRSRSVSFGVPA